MLYRTFQQGWVASNAVILFAGIYRTRNGRGLDVAVPFCTGQVFKSAA